MTDRDMLGFDALPPRIDRGDQFRYAKSTEQSNPEDALLARRVHASSYLGEGFLHDDAIDEHGYVAPDIDKARGDAVEYYLGYTPEGSAITTLRKINTLGDAGVESLPGYQLCEDLLTDEGKLALFDAELEGRPIKEISSFGHVPETTASSGLELLRHVLQESYGTGEVWFFTMVTQKYNTLVNLFGPRVVRKIGEPVNMDDERVGGVTLTPALVDTTSFFDDIAAGAIDEPNERKRQRMIGSLRHFAKGIDRAKLSDDVLSLLEDEPHFDFNAYVKQKDIQYAPNEWTQPLQLDLSNRIDSLHSKRLIDQGKVRNVINPAWHEEFPDMYEGNSEKDGKWFYYPWNESLVHFPDQADYHEMRHRRDRHLVTKEEQDVLYKKSALFAGLSVGSHVAKSMARAGTGALILADADTISGPNLNRLDAGMAQVGEHKTDAIAKGVSELDPYARLTLLREGVDARSLSELAKVPNIIFDEVDDFAAKALLRMYAKEHKLPLIMATDVGYKSIIDVERYDIEGTKPFNGRLSEGTIEAMLTNSLTNEQRMKAMTKLIGLTNASFRLLQSVSDPALEGLPQLGVTASQGGALATIVARDILLDRKVPSGRSVHDARRTMKLSSEVPLSDGLKIVQNYLKKS